MKNYFSNKLAGWSRVSGLASRVSGFTLIEIVVALAVVGLILGVTVTQMDRMLEREMKKTSNQLAATVRYLYNKAAMEKLFIRLVFDLDEQAYWVEATADPVLVTREGADAKSREKAQKKAKAKAEAAAKAEREGAPAEGEATGEPAPDEGGPPEKLKPPEPTFGPVESYLLRPSKLPDGVFFKDLQVEHRQGPVEGGKESIYFFPNGYVELAIINLRDEDDEAHYSLRTHPLSGQVDIENEYRAFEQR